MLGEIKKEHRDARKHNFIVPYQQVEFYDQTPEARSRYYVCCAEWCLEAGWTAQHMFVPLPPCVTYRASRLLSGDAAHPESPFWWLFFESEWWSCCSGVCARTFSNGASCGGYLSEDERACKPSGQTACSGRLAFLRRRSCSGSSIMTTIPWTKHLCNIRCAGQLMIL
jgi:hypothetical protein